MALTISLDLLTGSYEAGDTDDRRIPEWPPHPARLFCALVAAVRTQNEREALIWLEAQEPPLVVAAGRHTVSRSASFVVTNEVVAVGKSQTHPGRSNQLRVRARSFPQSPSVRFVWPGAVADESLVERLDALARRVPYIGRSTGLATAAVTAQDLQGGTASAPDAGSEAVQVFEPCEQFDGELSIRVPYAGYLDQLDELHEADRPAWQASRYLFYRARPAREVSAAPARVQPSVYRDVVILRFMNLRPEGRLVAGFTAQLRRRVLKAAGPGAPAALHGHGADGRPHVAFLALPNVASRLGDPAAQGADGRLLGVAVAIPDLPEPERRAVLAAVLGLRRSGEGGDLDTVDLDVPGIGRVELRYDPGLVKPWGATPQRWRQGSTQWVSATPVLLDRYPKRAGHLEQIIRDSARQVGLPEPRTVDVSSTPLVPGAVALQPIDLPDKFTGRLFRHVSLTFEHPVAGPVLLGAGRYLGIGLLAPVHTSTGRLGVGADPALNTETGEISA